jgi:hypothetical protein
MLIVTSPEKKKCVCCKTASVNEYLMYEYCGIELRIPLCTECQKTATFLLIRQLKPLCNSISKAVTMSYLLGEDEAKLRELRQKIQEIEAVQT